MRRSLVHFALLAILVPLASAHAAQPAALPKEPLALSVPRPAGGEWFGVYLAGKKVGWLFSEARDGVYDGTPAIVSTQRIVMDVTLDGKPVFRDETHERFYERRDHGRLMAFTLTKKGDGGDERLEGLCARNAVNVLRKRPHFPDETLYLPATGETVEAFDAPRIAAFGGRPLEGVQLDVQLTFQDQGYSSKPPREETRLVAGLKIPVRVVESRMAQLASPTMAVFAQDGRLLEEELGGISTRAEPEAMAKRLDRVDLFAAIHVPLAAPIPPEALATSVTYLLKGLPREMRRSTPRQSFEDAPDGRARLVVRATGAAADRAPPPADIGTYLEATPAIESTAPAIVAQARKIVGTEDNPRQKARRLNDWVYRSMAKAYGASSDRATDVLRTLKGDCTEHALLLTALARAVGVPARRVNGLVYMLDANGTPGLYWHEWAEVFIDGWQAMDPTLGQTVADAGHLALGGEGNIDAANVIGRLEVEVVTPASRGAR